VYIGAKRRYINTFPFLFLHLRNQSRALMKREACALTNAEKMFRLHLLNAFGQATWDIIMHLEVVGPGAHYSWEPPAAGPAPADASVDAATVAAHPPPPPSDWEEICRTVRVTSGGKLCIRDKKGRIIKCCTSCSCLSLPVGTVFCLCMKYLRNC